MPIRIEFNVSTGERKVIELTPEEVADAQTRTEAESAAQAATPVLKTLQERIAACEAALGLKE